MNGMNDMDGAGSPFYGKYRGKVTDNDDPNGLGRLRVKVQDVLGDQESGWALPALPYAGDGVGLYLIPPKDAFVWVEFEHGDPDYPIWTGCFWLSQSTVPKEASGPDIKLLKTSIATITIDDSDSGSSITIEKNGLKIVMDTNGIEISNGDNKITLSDTSVSVNGGALEVM
ncbi:MAG: phage baseplate assembly protein V [Chloroflexota bacterium]|nr:phage baseplate assembly protein V [Chloroflexota bacterium]